MAASRNLLSSNAVALAPIGELLSRSDSKVDDAGVTCFQFLYQALC